MSVPLKGVDGMDCRVYKSFEDALPIAGRWDEHLQLFGGPIYLSYDWCRIWWEFYGAGRHLRLFVFFVDNEIAGLLPMFFENITTFPLRIRVAQIVGSKSPQRIYNFGYKPEWTIEMLAYISRELLKNDQCDLVSMGSLERDEYQDMFLNPDIRHAFEEIGGLDIRSSGIFSRLYLPKEFNDYLSTLSPNERRKYKREGKFLVNELGVQFNLEDSSELLEEGFARFMEMHAQHWAKFGRPGHFKAWDKAKEFNMALVRHFHTVNALRFFSMTMDGRPLYFMYSFIFGPRYFCLLDARETLDEVRNVGLGRFGLITAINFAISENVQELELGAGHYEHKVRLGAIEEQSVRLRIKSARHGSRIKVGIFVCYFYLLNIFYYKIWYQRIQPVLPAFFRRPIIKLWLKYNV